MNKKGNLFIWGGFIQAFGVTLYCLLVSLFFWKGNEVFGKFQNYLGPAIFLILFIVSALICVALVFYRPYKLFFGEGKKKEAVNLVIATTVWLFLFLVVFLLLALVF
jgi:hypothetical protein